MSSGINRKSVCMCVEVCVEWDEVGEREVWRQWRLGGVTRSSRWRFLNSPLSLEAHLSSSAASRWGHPEVAVMGGLRRGHEPVEREGLTNVPNKPSWNQRWPRHMGARCLYHFRTRKCIKNKSLVSNYHISLIIVHLLWSDNCVLTYTWVIANRLSANPSPC